VRGPVDFWALARLASTYAVLVMIDPSTFELLFSIYSSQHHGWLIILRTTFQVKCNYLPRCDFFGAVGRHW
jgi:hypothetical protein